MTQAKNQALSLGGNSLSIGAESNAEKYYSAAGGTVTGKGESQSIPGRFLPTLTIDLTTATTGKP